jgi:hypothetical protein
MEDKPTNGELALMIKGLREVVELRFDENSEAHKAVNKHLETLNGQVARNTSFRTRWSGAYILIGVVGALAGLLATFNNFI